MEFASGINKYVANLYRIENPTHLIIVNNRITT